MLQPKVSVIVPVYNTGNYLIESLNSIKNQTLQEIEVICINDGSTDNSLRVLEQYSTEDARFRVVSQENQGQSAARNRGIQMAAGEYILFVDSDDLLDHDAVEYLYQEARKQNLEVLYFDAKTIYEDQRLASQKQSFKEYYQRSDKYQAVVSGKDLFAQMRKDSVYRVSPCLQLINRKFLLDSGVLFPPGIIHEDNVFTTQLILEASRVSHRNKAFYTRRLRNGSTMTNAESFRNLYGYFVCAVKLAEYARSKDLTQWPPLADIIHEKVCDIRRIFKKLGYAEKSKLCSMTVEEQSLLTEIVGTAEKMCIEKLSLTTGNPKVSVIVPVYNTEPYLKKCLDSVLGQSLCDMEIICVDDGSQDKSGEICEEYAGRDSRVKVIHQSNQGLSAARNTGIENASGDYIAFVDSDDWVHPNFLEVLYHLCADNMCLISQCGLQKVYEESDAVPEYRCDSLIQYGKAVIHKRFEGNGWIHGVTWNKLYHHSIFSDIRFPVGKQHEDEFTTYRALWKAYLVAYTECGLYYYRQRKDSIMGKGFSEKSLHVVEAYEERAAFFREKDKWLYQKSLLTLYSGISRCRKKVIRHCPDRTDLLTLLNEKYDQTAAMLREANIKYVDPPEDWPVFPPENYDTLPTAKHYRLHNVYYEGANSEAGIEEVVCKVSVIVPVYNTREVLSECLDSILSQSLDDLEVIAVDDGSSDKSLDTLRLYEKRDSRVVVVARPNMGVFVARNRAMKMARGEFICFMDSDDFYPDSGVLELLYRKAKENGVLICGGSFSHYRNGEIKESFEGLDEKYRFPEEGIVEYSEYQFDYGFHRFIYDRRFLLDNKISFPPYKRFQDPPFFVSAMIAAKRFYAVPDVVYRYRVGDHQAKPVSWTLEKLHDMLRGFIDNLTISRDARLADLHALTLQRFEGDYVYAPVMNAMLQHDYETMALLLNVSHAVDIQLLKDAGLDTGGRDYYIPGALKGLIWKANNPNRNFVRRISYSEEIQDEAALIRASWTYRIGRFITVIPRKLRGGWRCLKENGWKYTLNRIPVHLRLKEDPYK